MMQNYRLLIFFFHFNDFDIKLRSSLEYNKFSKSTILSKNYKNSHLPSDLIQQIK